MVRRSRKKRSSREDYPVGEQLKIEEGVFDTKTMVKLSRLFSKRIISVLDFITARGKEADVYIADAGESIVDEYVIVKIFRIETSAFKRRLDYIIGDPRFGHVSKNMYSVVGEWCKKEYGNLMVAGFAKVHAPKPYAFSGNVLAMEFIGEDGVPASQLKNVALKDPEKTLDAILDDMRKLYANNLVHGDVSEYNILMKGDTPYMIDFGQGVLLEHPEATTFLKRDIKNILDYFSRTYGIKKDPETGFHRNNERSELIYLLPVSGIRGFA